MIPQTYAEWKNCIENDCKIKLDKSFAEQRIAVYDDKSHPETKKFLEIYGENHLAKIIFWFKQIQEK